MKSTVNKIKYKKNLHQALLVLLCISILFNQITYAQESTIVTQEKSSDIKKVELQAVLTPPYVLGPGDGLTITDRTLKDIFGQVETFQVIVSADGYITVPLPDGTQENIIVAGSTLDEIAEQIRSLFGRTLINPLVFVQISKYRSINIYIGGEVVKSGVYKVDSSASDSFTLTAAIQLAGGLKPRADIRNIVVTRGASLEKKIIDLYQIVTGEDRYQDVNLQPGDAIFVSESNMLENQAQNNIPLLGRLAYQEVPVSVVGKVASPGSFTLANDATLIDALGKAGGIVDPGTLKKVRILRYDENGVYKTQKINVLDLLSKGTKADKIVLKPNDLIEIQTSPLKVAARYARDSTINLYSIALGGTISGFTGFLFQKKILEFTFEQNKKNLRNALGVAGGILSPPVDNSITIIESQRNNK